MNITIRAIATKGSDIASYHLAVQDAHRAVARCMVRSRDVARRHAERNYGIDIEIVAVTALQLHIVAVADRTVIRPLATRRNGTLRIVQTDTAEHKREYDDESAHNHNYEGKDKENYCGMKM